MIKFLKNRVWAHLPAEASRRARLWAAGLWSGALFVAAVLLAHNRLRHGVDPAFAPYVLTGLGVALGLTLVTPRAGDALYLWALRALAIPGFFLMLGVLSLGFYLLVTPMGLLMRLAGKDLLREGPKSAPHWVERAGAPDRKQFYRMF